MNAIEETATIQPDGTLVLQHPELKPGKQVKVIVLFAADQTRQKKPKAPPVGSKLKLDWGGGLADLGKQYTSVELQHKAAEWRGD